MRIRSEKRPSPFDDARPSEEKRVRLPIDASLSARAYSPRICHRSSLSGLCTNLHVETPDISTVADENYDACFGMVDCMKWLLFQRTHFVPGLQYCVKP